MNLLEVGALWLISWVAIIALYGICLHWIKSGKLGPEYSLLGNKMVSIIEDGNNLFSTGLVYFIGNVICYFVNNTIIHYVIMIVGILFTLPSVGSLAIFLVTSIATKDRYYIMSALSATINTFIPLAMAINIYFRYIQS